jgi:hypothetical protein
MSCVTRTTYVLYALIRHICKSGYIRHGGQSFVNVSLGIDEALLAQAREHAASKGSTLNGLVRSLLEKPFQSPLAKTGSNASRLSLSKA